MTTLLVDDDATLREMLQQAFEIDDLPIDVESNPRAALARVTPDFAGVVVTDVRMPEMDGLELFRRIHAIDPEIPVIVMTGHSDVPMVIDAMRNGVFDFIPKPFSVDHLIASVRRALDLRSLVLENRSLRAAAAVADASEPLIGESSVMVRLRDTIRQLAQADVDVLIAGETGTGKELAAILLHRWGPRRRNPFVALNCAALPSGLAEPELLGHEPGGQGPNRWGQTGRIEASDGGTLFLDETASMPPSVQGVMLRVVEEREVYRLGADRPRPLNLRIVAATNVDLAAAVAAGTFRQDLYYRLNPVQIRLPPLRERMEDVPLLFAHFLDEASRRLNRDVPVLTRDVLAHLSAHPWPGNVRELRSYAQRILLGLSDSDAIDGDGNVDLVTRVADFEAAVIRRTLEQCAGDIVQAQAKLGLARNTLYDKMKRYDLRAADYRKR